MQACHLHPPLQVAAAIVSRDANVLSGGQDDVMPCDTQFMRQLHAGGRGSDNQHAARGNLGGAAVVLRGDLCDLGRQRGREAGDRGYVARTGREDQRVASQRPAAGVEPVGDPVAGDGGDTCLILHRCPVGVCVGLEHRDQLGHGHETVGIGALVAATGETALPVGGEQPEGVPALGLPGIGDLSPFEHHVGHRTLGETAAHGKTGLPGADDDGGNMGHSLSPREGPPAGGKKPASGTGNVT